jgi:hypothetical protein
VVVHDVSKAEAAGLPSLAGWEADRYSKSLGVHHLRKLWWVCVWKDFVVLAGVIFCMVAA